MSINNDVVNIDVADIDHRSQVALKCFLNGKEI